MQGAAAKASPQEKEKPTPAPKRKSAAALKAEKAEKAKQKAAKVKAAPCWLVDSNLMGFQADGMLSINANNHSVTEGP